MEFKIHFSARAHSYMDEEVNTVVEAMQMANPLTQGKYLNGFEEKFSRYTGTKNAFAVSNATCGLEMAAQLCQFQPGDEIIAPLHTYTSSVYPFIKKGAKVVWADIDLKTRVISSQTIVPKITPKTRAIVVVHLYGYGADMPEIMSLARKHNLLVIEDAAQSLGADVDGTLTGAFGDIGVFSFHSHKNITTLGEGGMVTLADDSMAAILPMLRHNGHTPFENERENYWIPAMGNLELPKLNGEYLWPNNYCVGEVESALGIKLIDRIDEINQDKRKRALWFIDALEGFPELEWHRVDSSRHNYHLLVAQMSNGRRDEFISKMAFEKGVQCIVQYCPLNRYPLYKSAGFGVADCPCADSFFDNMISFPFHSWMTEEELEYSLQSTIEVLKEMKK